MKKIGMLGVGSNLKPNFLDPATLFRFYSDLASYFVSFALWLTVIPM